MCNDTHYLTFEVVEAKKQLAHISWRGKGIRRWFIMQVVKKIQLIASGNNE
jgi:hypothetical protein